MNREQLFRGFFFGAFALLLWQLLKVFSPFLPAFLWGLTFTLVFYPLFPYLRRRLPSDLAALLAAAAVFIGVLVPLGGLGYVLARESAAVVPAAEERLAGLREGGPAALFPRPLAAAWDRVDQALSPTGFDTRRLLLENLDAVQRAVARAAAQAARQAALLLFSLVVLAISLFFFFRWGEDLAAWFMDLIPMDAAHKDSVAQSLRATFNLIVRGVLANALVQGLLAGVGFWLAGLRFPVYLAFACAFASLIPLGGTALVWGPTALILLSRGEPARGAFVFLWGLLIVSLLDRVIVPALTGGLKKGRTGLPALLLFLSILGGLRVYGLHGVLLGPLLVTVALAFARIYKEEFYKGL